jgi:cytosine/adenosine deaminase-related metal-dependent hydrolase
MKISLFKVISAFTATLALTCSVFASSTYLEGYEPNPRAESQVRKIYLLIEDGKITKKSLNPFITSEGTKKILEAQIGKVLLSSGFIDLHGHLKYNVVSLWNEAHGQFGNRFQWRGLPGYKKNVTGPLNNPLLGDKTNKDSLYCQTYQYAEIKALAGGVTSVQGVGGDQVCTQGILARNVEIETDYAINSGARISMEVISPDSAKLFSEKVYPTMISEKKSTDEVIAQLKKTEGAINATQKDFFESLAKYLGYVARMLPGGDIRSFIVHLSEGRGTDQYNKLEYKFANQLGLAKNGLVVIHGVGMDEKDLIDAAQKDISLVWSPFSNLILYGETLNAELALKNNVNLTLGSDWTPSGTKNLLEEVKVARRYAQSKGMKLVTDKKLYEMMTINAAKALKLSDRLGRLEEGYLADIVAIRLTSQRTNPYTQIVMAAQSDIQYVMVGGELKVAKAKIAGDEANADSLLTQDQITAHASCLKLAEQQVMNSPLKLSELVANMKSVFPQLDSLTSCNDENYKTVLANLLTPEWKAATPAEKLDAKNYDRLAEQLELLK